MLQFLTNGLCMGAVVAVVALGFGLIYTTTRVFHVAHGGVYVLTGYVLWMVTTSLNLPFAIGVLLALGASAVTGALIEWAVYYPLAQRSASSAVLMISSLGVQIVFE